MRTKEQLIEEIKNMDLNGEQTEPVVSSSVYTCKNLYKCCVYFYKTHGGLGDKERIRLTINLYSSNKRDADKEAFDLERRCQEAMHLSFISLNKHDFLESIEKWVIASDKTNRVEKSTLATMYQNLRIVKNYSGFKGLAVEEFTQADINKFCDWALDEGGTRKDGLAYYTVKNLHSLIYGFFSFAYNRGIVNRNPCDGTVVPNRRKEDNNEDKKQWLDDKEYKALRNWLKEQIELGRDKYEKLIDIIDIEVYTGMRREELFGLKWNCMDFDNGLLYTGGARVLVGSTELYKSTLKNKDSHRVYCLTDKILDIFKAIRERHEKLGVYAQDKFIFVNENSRYGIVGKPIGLHTASSLFKEAIMKCDDISDKSIHFHNLRHTCCTLMFKEGYTKGEIQNWLGHKEGSLVTERVYNHYRYSIPKSRMERLSSLIGD